MDHLVLKINAAYKKKKVEEIVKKSKTESSHDAVKYVSRWYYKVKCRSLSHTYFTRYKP